MGFRRIRQVIKYGWKHANVVSQKNSEKSRIYIFLDIISCYRKYHLWSNQYVNERFYALNPEERNRIGNEYKEKNDRYEEIKRDKLENRVFLNKWKSYYWELGYDERRKKRREAYALRYNMGKNCDISFDVHIECNHFLPGSIKIGDNVLLGKHVYIDYSGNLDIKDNVQLTNGVIIETHHHPFHSNPSANRDIVLPTSLVIEEGAVIGSRAIILSTCHYIGKFARIGAGAVVTKDVPDYSVVVGVPANVVRYIKNE